MSSEQGEREAIRPELLDILFHSLGGDRAKSCGWRNHFCTDKDDPLCRELEALGFMTSRKSPVSDDWLFHVTFEGKLVVQKLKGCMVEMTRTERDRIAILSAATTDE